MADVFLVSDFNAELASRFIRVDHNSPALSVETAPYGQVFQMLSSERPGSEAMTLFVWTRPEGIAPSFAALTEGESVSIERLLDAVDIFAETVKNAAQRFRTVLVASWTRSESGRGSGLLDWSGCGQARALARMNLRLADRLEGHSNVRLLDSQRWLDVARPPRDARYWYAMKFPFTEFVAQAAALDVKAAVRAFSGQARKLVVLDLDGTLWGGVIGETGWQGIRLGGHDAVGEAYVDFQKALKTLSARGVALGVVSKNTEAVALEAFDHHPEMALRRSDLAGWRINWRDKAENFVELVRDLNLGLQSVVFIDDNPTERGRIAEAFPEVLVPDWPKDACRFADALRQLDCFDQPSLTDEDRSRVKMYVRERERTESQRAAGSVEDWLNGLGVQVSVEAVGGANLARASQLANKTNQMNLRTRRITGPEFLCWLLEGEGRQTLAIRVADRFGEIGLTGLISWELADDALEIIDFVLSCRAMGRQIENLMVHLAVEAARAQGSSRVIAHLFPTSRNGPCREFWKGSGFDEPETNLFVWDATKPYPRPAFIEVEADTEGATSS
jgi:FkbH-like protein